MDLLNDETTFANRQGLTGPQAIHHSEKAFAYGAKSVGGVTSRATQPQRRARGGLRLLLGAAAVAALAACEPTATGGMVQTASGPVDPAEMVANAPPMGTAPLDLGGAMLAYQSICLDTLPRFATAEEVVRRQGMAQNPTTGTWFDPRRELSVNLEPRGGRPACSIVFASNESPALLSLTLAVGTSSSAGGSPGIGIDPEGGGAMTSTANGAEMVFETGIGGRSNLHRVLLVAGR